MDKRVSSKEITVEVAYALPERQKIISLLVPEGTTLYQAAELSGICDDFPELDLASAKMGIFGRAVPKPAEQAMKSGERVEIYRPLIADPKEVRRKRAEKAKAAKAAE
ncbi:RnfH family protein [Sansalvadorimonas verongulae]|uniref:RnfH family protein n=1 Tax=Sansalvadorimonas verongulae TaxID=2172824 RepID=UPI0012BB84A0|nr:RnfH family protein [Sansalvadorimonas verongulae]MTI15114.1 RnfH family protein [Sansalvadorimonas verongulae]